jgi:hypothetical protein
MYHESDGIASLLGNRSGNGSWGDSDGDMLGDKDGDSWVGSGSVCDGEYACGSGWGSLSDSEGYLLRCG